MKHNKMTCFTSMMLAGLLTVSSVVGGSVSVFATDSENDSNTESNQGIEITSENTKSDDGQIVIDDNGITISQESEDIVVESAEQTSSVSVALKKADDNEITIEKSYVAGDEVPVTLNAKNTSKQDVEYRVYFWNDKDATLETKVEDLKSPATDVKIVEADKDGNIKMSLSNKEEVVGTIVTETKDDKVTACYLSVTLPAGTSLESDVTLVSESGQVVTVVPMGMTDPVLTGDVSQYTWDAVEIDAEEANTSDKKDEVSDIVIETTTPEDGFASVFLGDKTEETKSLNASDFASMRLVVVTDDKTKIPNESDVIGAYGNLYLIQFTSIQQTMNAYVHFKDLGLSVEPDMTIQVANKDGDIDLITNQAEIPMDETQNPMTVLQEATPSEPVQKEHGVIAVIDTGAKEHPNVIDRVSMIDDVLEGHGHGDQMIEAIVGQDKDAKILSIRAMDDKGFGTVSSLVAAIECAMDQKVDMINLSLYARTTLSTSVLKDEIQKAMDAGIVVIGAAGNDGVDVADYVPGSVENAWIIGAAKEDGSRLETSNFGKTVDYNVVAGSTSGVDVADYVPGSVENAWIIGAAKEDGSRLETSNFGKTVDYNVVAGSTSEATAKFTGFISANGLDKVQEVLNQGLIYATDFVIEEPENPVEDVDFSKYKLVQSKTAGIRYTYADASKLTENDTLDSLFLGTKEDFLDKVYATTMMIAEVYDAGDGTYKFKANGPLMNGQVVGGEYTDVIFSEGNDTGDVITDGISIDRKTGVVTADKKLFEKARDEQDFCDLQVQVLIPSDGIPKSFQTITVENKDGSTYTKKIELSGFGQQIIPLDIKGVDGALTAKDFDVYVNGNRLTSAITWDDEKHEITVGDYSNGIYRVDIKVKADVQAMFVVADAGYRGYSALFYLPTGTDVSKLTVNAQTTVSSVIGHPGFPAFPQAPSHQLGSPITWYPGGSTGGTPAHMGYLGMPFNLFGLNWRACDANGNQKPIWSGTYNYGSNSFSCNSPIWTYCNHLSAPISPGPMMNVTYKIIDRWQSGKYTYFTMTFITELGFADSSTGASQHIGGLLNFAVQADSNTKLKVVKTWEDYDNKFNTRPTSIEVQLKQKISIQGNSWKVLDTQTLSAANGWAYEWRDLPNKFNTRPTSIEVQLKQKISIQGNSWKVLDTQTLSAANGWAYEWRDLPRLKNGVTYDYDISEVKVPYYDGTLKWEGDYNVGYVGKLHNKVQDGWVKLHKASGNPDITNGNPCYNLKGATYTFYMDKACTKQVGKLVTDANGDTEKLLLTPGTYYYKETKTTDDGHYELDPQVYTVKVTPQNTVNNPMMLNVSDMPGNDPYYYKETKTTDDGHYELDPQVYTVKVTPQNTVNNPMMLNVSDMPGNDPLGIRMTKIWTGAKTGTVPPLTGTQFTIEYYANMNRDTSGKAVRTWILELKYDADVDLYMALLHEDYLVDGSDPLYKSPNSGISWLPYGTYKIWESKPAPNYTLDGTLSSVKDPSISQSTRDPYITVVDKGVAGVSLVGGNEYLGKNENVPMSLTVKKFDENNKPLAGVTFTLKSKSGYAETQPNWKGSITTGADGIARWDNLYPDTYTITEAKTAAGKNLLKEPIVVDLPGRMTPEDAQKYNLKDPNPNDKMDGVVWDPYENVYFINDPVFEVTNDVTFKVPMTGGVIDFWRFMPLLGGFTLIGGYGLYVANRKRRRHAVTWWIYVDWWLWFVCSKS